MRQDTQSITERLDGLRAELADLAFLLESRGRRDAADVTNSIAARVAEICSASVESPVSPAGETTER